MPDHLIKATLATEDRRFFEHFGVDFLGTARALVENARANEVVQGGSTLTQQLAKNLFLSPERSIQRKVKEAFLAFLLESRFTKREILKLYLDRAYHGRRRIRRRSGLAILFRQVGARAEAGRVGAAGRAVQGAVASSPRTSTCRPRGRAPTMC